MVSLSEMFVGQESLVNQVQTVIDASKKRGQILPHILLVAPPGVGKTRLAVEISRFADAPYAAIEFPAEQKVLINTLINHTGVLLLDEVHQADRKTLDALLPFLVDGLIRFGRVVKENHRITVVAATTDPQKLPDAFVSRFRVKPVFGEYDVESLTEIIRRQGILADEETMADLARASLGNPRQGVQLAETYEDLFVLNNEEPVSAEEVLAHLGFTRDGLRPEHVQYLRCLENQGGVASQATIAKMVFMPTEALKWVERDLLRLGIIGVSSAGRELQRTDWGDGIVSNTDEGFDDNTNVNPYTLQPLDPMENDQ